MQERQLPLKDVCELLGVSPSTVRRRIKDDDFPRRSRSVQPGGTPSPRSWSG